MVKHPNERLLVSFHGSGRYCAVSGHHSRLGNEGAVHLAAQRRREPRTTEPG